ncbi:hypothetical protein PR048_027064 [Dryococelus australis]|uniref:Uncharacterized protein n=1 Tax=Dryococelus australis TaxID=614101 RepID=A0ABQ9GEF1_9NEOP|nr:hypothetical protein PR048_027064 [Dryococelus australis]
MMMMIMMMTQEPCSGPLYRISANKNIGSPLKVHAVKRENCTPVESLARKDDDALDELEQVMTCESRFYLVRAIITTCNVLIEQVMTCESRFYLVRAIIIPVFISHGSIPIRNCLEAVWNRAHFALCSSGIYSAGRYVVAAECCGGWLEVRITSKLVLGRVNYNIRDPLYVGMDLTIASFDSISEVNMVSKASPTALHLHHTLLLHHSLHPIDNGAAVAQRLERPPPTRANRVRFPTGSLSDIRTWESYQATPLFGGFSRGSPVSPCPRIPELLLTHLTSPSSAFKTSLLRAGQISPLHSNDIFVDAIKAVG